MSRLTSSFSSSATKQLWKQTGWWVWLREFFHSRMKVLYYHCIIDTSDVIWSMPYSFGLPTMQKIVKVEGVQLRATKMIPTLCNKPYKERLSHLNLFSLKKRWLRGKLIECFNIFNGFTNVDPTNLFETDESTRTRNNGAKLKCRQVHSDCTKFFIKWCPSRSAQITAISGAVQYDCIV